MQRNKRYLAEKDSYCFIILAIFNKKRSAIILFSKKVTCGAHFYLF